MTLATLILLFTTLFLMALVFCAIAFLVAGFIKLALKTKTRRTLSKEEQELDAIGAALFLDDWE